MDERSMRQRALDEAAEVIRMCYPRMEHKAFVASQDWFGRYQHLLTGGRSPAMDAQFGDSAEGDPHGPS